VRVPLGQNDRLLERFRDRQTLSTSFRELDELSHGGPAGVYGRENKVGWGESFLSRQTISLGYRLVSRIETAGRPRPTGCWIARVYRGPVKRCKMRVIQKTPALNDC
jgi:hypothetical protein